MAPRLIIGKARNMNRTRSTKGDSAMAVPLEFLWVAVFLIIFIYLPVGWGVSRFTLRIVRKFRDRVVARS